MAWRIAYSIRSLIEQANAVAPRRSKFSDGTIGNLAHARTKSDHNPNAEGRVSAVDLTHDPRGGFDAHLFAGRMLKSQDARLMYVISNGRIGSGPSGLSPGRWRAYHGANRHDKHVHVSVVAGSAGDRAGRWAALAPGPVFVPASLTTSGTGPAAVFTGKPDRLPVLSVGDSSGWVRLVQDCLGLDKDAEFGPLLQRAVTAQQARYGLRRDGVVGPWTWVSLVANAGDLAPGAARGHSGLEVLQNLLGFRGAALDRDYGPQVTGRVRALQRWGGIEVDGRVGPITRSLLTRG